MSDELYGTSKLESDSWKMALKWTILLAAHFRVELSEPETRIYCEALKNRKPDDIETGMYRALHECDYMPRLKDILDRMPEVKTYYRADQGFVPVRDWEEPYSKTAKMHVWENEYGDRRVAFVKYQLGEVPMVREETGGPVMSATEFRKFLDDIAGLAKEKSMPKMSFKPLLSPEEMEKRKRMSREAYVRYLIGQ